MKVFFDTNILLDVAIRADKYPHSVKLVNDLLRWPEASCWISALSLSNIEQTLSQLGKRDKARQFLSFIRQHFAILPVRRSSFRTALQFNEGEDFTDAVQSEDAAAFGMDFLVTGNPDRFTHSRIPALTPADFLSRWDKGELRKTNHVPFLDLKAQHHLVYNDIDDRITDIIANTGFIQGKYVKEFEECFAALSGATHCIGLSTGTDALHIALLALGIGHGDKVLLPVNTFFATAEAVSLCGAEPVFVDCDAFYNIDSDGMRRQLAAMPTQQRSAFKAVIPVHLYGQPADMDRLSAVAKEYGLTVIEDCCQAHLAEWRGGKVGTFGAFGAFSFYPGKNLGAYGEAGALITNDPELARQARMIRQHGEIQRYHHEVVGHNYRMEEIQGAVLAVKCGYLPQWTMKRRENATRYNELLASVPGVGIPAVQPGAEPVYHLYVIEVANRDGLQRFLQENGIATGIHYPIPLHLQEAYHSLGYGENAFPRAERAAKRIISLPMYPELNKDQISYVCEKIAEYQKREA